MERRRLEDLNLLDDFLFQELVTREEEGEKFCQMLLSTILEQKFRNVKVIPQKNISGLSIGHHGIKIDAYIEADAEEEFIHDFGKEGAVADVKMRIGIYDIEPNKYQIKNEAKRTRYYHSLIDAKILRSGADYHELKNVVIIMILPYDPFGKNRMVYTFENHCKEDHTVECNDGAKTIYLYTKGIEGNPGKDLQNMLKYIEESTLENAVNEDLRNIHSYVEEIRHDEEVGVSYMKAFELEKMYREEGKQQGIEQGVQALIAVCNSLGVTKEVTLEKLKEGFGITTEEANKNLEKYWK